MPVRPVTKAKARVLTPHPVTESPFYGGRLSLRQPATGYRAAIDPVLLAASLNPRLGAVLLDLGCGVGAASLCLLARRADVSVIGVEVDPVLADLARQNAALNGMEGRFTVIEGAVEALSRADMPQIAGVFTNPPFHAPVATLSPEARRARATHGAVLADWTARAARLLPHRGSFSLIYRADGLPEILAALAAARFGGITVSPLWPRAGTPAKRVCLQATLGSRAALQLQPGLILHGPGSDFTPQADAILRGQAEWETA
ncbi:MAG: tRNA1(Val) (adenine(37)-N6)-methyltransferase [Elstera sp.]